MTTLFLDTETFSATDIRAGTDNYTRNAEIMIWTWAVEDGPVRAYDATTGAPMPAELEDALLDERVRLIAHNARFDMSVLKHNGFPTPIERWYCTMAQALAHGLPGSLDKLCDIFNLSADVAKIKDGKSLIHLFCKPRPKNVKLRRATRETHPDEWARFIEYAVNDISAMRALHKIMPKWNYGYDTDVARHELALWHLDQQINEHGVLIDVHLVDSALETADRVKKSLADDAFEMTAGAIGATTQRDALLKLLRDVHGLDIDDLRGSTVEKLLKSDVELPPIVVDLLGNRLAASSTSVSKYKAFAKITGPDGRLRNTIQFCGASRTGRDAGRGVQLQNLPRPTMKQKAIDAGIRNIKDGIADLIYENPMELLSSAVRGAIVAPADKKLSVADLSNIEGRVLAWLAGEDWKLQAFKDFDTCLGKDGEWHTGDAIRDAILAGNPIPLELDKKGEPTRKGHDLYALAYSRAFGISPEAVMENKRSGDGSFRQGGKILELACGYQGSVGAFATFALAFGIDLDDMARKAFSNIPPAVMEKAGRAWDWANREDRTYGMSELAYKVCWSFVRLWRDSNPNIESLWSDLEAAFRKAILTPGAVFDAGRLKVVKQGNWVRMRLPSGRSLCYPSPKLEGENDKITILGVNQFTRQWCRQTTYGGKLVENATQGAARCTLKAPTPMIARAGYQILVPVHDELITEAPLSDDYNADHLAALMASNPAWAKGLPLAAAGFDSMRYKKD